MIERPEVTFQNYAENGLRTMSSPSLRKDHIVSVYKETNRLVDDYTYYVDNEGLYWLTEDKTPQKIYIKSSLDRSTSIRKTEGEHFDKLESWAKEADSGVAIWFSPDSNTSYPCSKAILHKISYSIRESLNNEGYNTPVKSLAVSSLNIDVPSNEIISFVHDLFPNLNVSSPEELRGSMVVFESDEELFSFVNKIYLYNKNIKDKTLDLIYEAEIEKRAWYISDMFSQGFDSWTITQAMKDQELLGKFSISCGGGVTITGTLTSSETTTTPAYGYYETQGWHNGTCRVCNISGWVGPCEICSYCASKL